MPAAYKPEAEAQQLGAEYKLELVAAAHMPAVYKQGVVRKPEEPEAVLYKPELGVGYRPVAAAAHMPVAYKHKQEVVHKPEAAVPVVYMPEAHRPEETAAHTTALPEAYIPEAEQPELWAVMRNCRAMSQ